MCPWPEQEVTLSKGADLLTSRDAAQVAGTGGHCQQPPGLSSALAWLELPAAGSNRHTQRHKYIETYNNNLRTKPSKGSGLAPRR